MQINIELLDVQEDYYLGEGQYESDLKSLVLKHPLRETLNDDDICNIMSEKEFFEQEQQVVNMFCGGYEQWAD